MAALGGKIGIYSLGETFPKLPVLEKFLSKGPQPRLDLFIRERSLEEGNSGPGKCGIMER